MSDTHVDAFLDALASVYEDDGWTPDLQQLYDMALQQVGFADRIVAEMLLDTWTQWSVEAVAANTPQDKWMQSLAPEFWKKVAWSNNLTRGQVNHLMIMGCQMEHGPLGAWGCELEARDDAIWTTIGSRLVENDYSTVVCSLKNLNRNTNNCIVGLLPRLAQHGLDYNQLWRGDSGDAFTTWIQTLVSDNCGVLLHVLISYLDEEHKTKMAQIMVDYIIKHTGSFISPDSYIHLDDFFETITDPEIVAPLYLIEAGIECGPNLKALLEKYMLTEALNDSSSTDPSSDCLGANKRRM